MSDVQRVIKYLAIAFAIYLVVLIVGAIISILGGLLFFGSDGVTSYEMVSSKFDENYEIKKMVIDIKASHLVIEDGEEFYVETNNSRIEVKQNKDEINIKEKGFSWNRNNSSKVIVHIPTNHKFDRFYLDAGAGKIDISSLKTNDLDLELGAGQVIIDNIESYKKSKIDGGAGEFIIKSGTLTNLDFDMGVGYAKFTSSILGNSDIDAGVGELNINIIGAEDDYELEIDKGVGNVLVDGKNVGSDTRVGYGINKIDIDGGVGRITVDFVEEEKKEETKPEESNKKTFTRTYKVLNKTDYQEKDSYYLTLQLFQGEVDTVIVRNIKDIEEGKTYEFTFTKDSTKKVDDNIKSIFNNYELAQVKETDKIGLSQIQEAIN
ncbi:MAG TPA: hypothetical protein DCE23_01810 [Firmicutes bacterium]|nr:hypothetical protein [Bacillota bacterium]